jgi:hypothetical protein
MTSCLDARRLEAQAYEGSHRQGITALLEGGQRNGLDTVSIEQHTAIDILILGHTDHAVAEQIGVARETICRWRNEHPYFMAELNRRRKDVWQTAQERLRGLVGKAIDIL